MNDRKDEPLKYAYNFKALQAMGFIPDAKKSEDKLIENWRRLRDLTPDDLKKEFGVKIDE